jgi:hypothetical protein
MNKLNKYIKKYSYNPQNHYLNKIAYYLIDSNKIVQTGGLVPNDTSSLLEFLKKKSEEIPFVTNNKYFVVLYGPPASGKSIARKIACHYIKKIYKNETLMTLDMEKSFVDTGVDEITYEIEVGVQKPDERKIKPKEDTIKIKQKLLENLNEKIPGDKNKDAIKAKIEELVKSSFEIYKANRADAVSELMFYFAVFLGKNIFMETSSGDIAYVDKMVNTLKFYGYIPMIVYPFINDVSILYERSLTRGINEGRFLRCGDPFGLTIQMSSCLNNYEKLKENIRKNSTYCTVQYNANFSKEIFDEMNGGNFSELQNYILDEEYKEVTKGDKVTDIHTHHAFDNNYKVKTVLSLDCTKQI